MCQPAHMFSVSNDREPNCFIPISEGPLTAKYTVQKKILSFSSLTHQFKRIIALTERPKHVSPFMYVQ